MGWSQAELNISISDFQLLSQINTYLCTFVVEIQKINDRLHKTEDVRATTSEMESIPPWKSQLAQMVNPGSCFQTEHDSLKRRATLFLSKLNQAGI